jgi:hypothetical protein
MVVAIGAVALISVGLAAIFQAVGKTVSGGKRLSLVTNYAALLESRMRADFGAMTRRGPLVIRQQWVDANGNGMFDAAPAAGATSPDAVELSAVGADNPNGPSRKRQRRIDEIVFFGVGSFTSARESPLPGALVQSTEARIYYGHGQRRDIGAYGGDEEPEISDQNIVSSPDMLLGRDVDGNPNRYASNWTLVRAQTLLVKPETAPQPGYGTDWLGVAASSGRLANKSTQIALMPAATSAFRSIAAVYPDLNASYPGAPFINDPTKIFRDWPMLAAPPYPPDGQHPHARFSSGIIDIATTSLDEIRATILGNCRSNTGMTPTTPLTIYTLGTVPALNFEIPQTNPSTSTAPSPNANTAESLDVMHAWMADLFPTQSLYSGALYPDNTSDPAGVRIRTEPTAIGLDEVMRESALASTAGNPTELRKIQEEKTDREMMVANNLLPHCSEFKVEWSYGDQVKDPTVGGPGGQLKWHGPRPATAPGEIDTTSPAPYPWDPSLTTPTPVPTHKIPLTKKQGSLDYAVTARLIYGRSIQPSQRPLSLTSYFGYIDPTYKQNAATDPATMPWAWPKLIRVTVSVADPDDATFETTFQYIFEVPDDSRPQ